jgi:hypothetical protein
LWPASASGLDWHFEVVAPSGCNPSMAIDADGRPHIAYSHFNSGGLEYAHWDGSQWVHSVIATAGSSQAASLVLDSQGRPRVAYVTADMGTAFACLQGSAWTIENAAGYKHVSPSLALDAANNASIVSWNDSLGRTDYLVRGVDGAWTATSVGPTGSAFTGECLAFDHENVPHIAGALPGGLAMASPGASDWNVALIAGNPLGAAGVSLAYDQGNRANIVQNQHNEGILKFTSWDGTAWQTQVVDGSGHAVAYGHENLALDSSGYANIVYSGNFDPTGRDRQDINYARWNGHAWEMETVAPWKSGGGYSYSVAVGRIDDQDVVHIAYGDLSTLAVMHAWAVIPEPATLALLALTGAALLARRRRKSG